jgi:hypothetical protein
MFMDLCKHITAVKSVLFIREMLVSLMIKCDLFFLARTFRYILQLYHVHGSLFGGFNNPNLELSSSVG